MSKPTVPAPNDWEAVVGMFRNDPVMADIMDAGQRIRKDGAMPNDRTQRLLYLVALTACLGAGVVVVWVILGTGQDMGWW